MTALARTEALVVRPVPGARRRAALRLVPQRLTPSRSTARRAPFVAVVLALLAGGLLGLLALNTVLAQDAFRLHELQVQGKELADREQALSTAVEALQAPRAIAERARALQMVPGGPPAFLRLPDGVVLGEGAVAVAPQPDLVGEAVVPPAPAVEQDTRQDTQQQDETETAADEVTR